MKIPKREIEALARQIISMPEEDRPEIFVLTARRFIREDAGFDCVAYAILCGITDYEDDTHAR